MLRTSAKTSAQAGMKLARLLEMPEADFEKRVRELESEAFFRDLLATRVVSIAPYANTGFGARRFGGWGLSTASDGLAGVLDGQGELAQLLQRVGQERFEECFLRDEGMADLDCAKRCGISMDDAMRLRELVNKLYVQAEFDDGQATAAPSKTYSTVAGVAMDGKRPMLAFFNREIWKGRYQIDEKRRDQVAADLAPQEARRLEKFLRELELLDRRKTTLYRVLEVLVQEQTDYFASGDLTTRRALTQREVCQKLDVDASVLNRLIANKSIELPWGLEAPLKSLLPSRKSLLRDRLYDLIQEHPTATDVELGRRLHRLYGVKLGWRSIAQYRTELGLGNLRERRSKA